MNLLLKIFYVLIIIIGGWVYIISNGKIEPIPDGCIMCGLKFLKPLSLVLVAIGIAAFIIQPKAIRESQNLK